MASQTGELTLESCLDDVETRFLFNLPESELSQSERLFFQIEQAWWFYEDFFADKYPHLPHFSRLKSFAAQIFKHCPLLVKAQHKFNELFNDFGLYRSGIPVCGCILMTPDMSKIALACNWDGKSWTFPRGKVDEDESLYDCAIRETLEETGYDVRGRCNEDDMLLNVTDSRMIYLFIVTNVPENTQFTPLTRKEISKVTFFPIDNLPKSTYDVLPFISKLKRWIGQRYKKSNKKQILSVQQQQSSHKSPSRRDSSRKRDSSRIMTTPSRSSQKDVMIMSKSPANTTAMSIHDLRQKIGQNTSKKMSNSNISMAKAFDTRNTETFSDEIQAGQRRWTVSDMFKANSQLTGSSYTYDGNPHEFGSSHPRFVNYRDSVSADNKGTVSSSSSSVMVNIEMKKANTHASQSILQLLNNSSVKHNNTNTNLTTSTNTGTTTATTTNSNNNNNSVPIIFPRSFKFDIDDIMSVVEAELKRTAPLAFSN